MNSLLTSDAGFLNTPGGIALFVVFDLAVLVLIFALNYRWLCKRLLDWLFATLFLIVFFPFFLLFLLADALYNRVTNAYKTLFETGVYCGKNERTIRVTVFATERIQHDATGALLSVRDRSTAWGRFLRGSGIKYYPCLLAIFLGKMSFVGPRLMSLTDAEALREDARARFAVRPGLVSSLERYGGEKLTYPDMFEEDIEYCKHINLFRDVAFFVTKIVNLLRGEGTRRYGICAETGYVDWLRQTGAITAEEAEEFAASAQSRLRRRQAAARERKDFAYTDPSKFR